MRLSSLSIPQSMTVHPKPSQTTGKAFAERVRRARLARQVEIGRDLEQDEIGREIARYWGQQEAVKQGTVSRWFRGSVPDLRTIWALASVLNVDAGWLGFGDLSKAPRPTWWAATGGGTSAESDDELATDVEAMEAAEARAAPRHRKPRGA